MSKIGAGGRNEMKRRGFLGTLLGTPAMARVAAEQLAPAEGTYTVSEVTRDSFTVDNESFQGTCVPLEWFSPRPPGYQNLFPRPYPETHRRSPR